MAEWSEIDDGLLNPAWYVNGDPHEAFERLRAEDPVHWAEPESYGRPFWALTRYQDVREVLADAANFSNYRDTRPPRTAKRLTATQLHESGTDGNLNHMDPPLHTLYRRPMERHFDPLSREHLRVLIENCADELIAEVGHRGRTEFVGELAADLPMHVIMRFLGVPREDWTWLRDCVWRSFLPDDPRFAVPGQASEKTMADANQMIADYAARFAREKRERPGDDFASVLTEVVVDGTPLDDHEVAAWLALLIPASLETTRNTASVGLWLFYRNPEQRQALAQDPALIGQAVDEVIRWASPVRSRLRVARFDTEVGGKAIKAGDWVVPFLSSANRDASVFEDPHAFNIRRQPRKHLSFGEGVHECLALHLVRCELMTLFSKFFAAFPDYELPQADSPSWIADHVLNGFTRLEVDLNVT
ncbi:cytochrome P450 [Saccharopolyspora sp. S2-29]|uniref:Cytochrome P450 n=2 Tax=Saccharopolyspora mangrovi TaxID=3082379 RepID=A0ABU6AKD2_9PSEU|nr:cytochrome P450 [Saccharopolyspora sp. S2-29]